MYIIKPHVDLSGLAGLDGCRLREATGFSVVVAVLAVHVFVGDFFGGGGAHLGHGQ